MSQSKNDTSSEALEADELAAGSGAVAEVPLDMFRAPGIGRIPAPKPSPTSSS